MSGTELKREAVAYVGCEVRDETYDRCKECGADGLIEEVESMVCTECGTRGPQIISTGAEWRSFRDDGQEKSRVGQAGTLDKYLGGEDMGTTVASESGSVGDLQRRHGRDANQKLRQAMQKLKSKASDLKLGGGVEHIACQLFAKARECQEMKTRKEDALILACLSHACKVEGIPRQYKELMEAFPEQVKPKHALKLVKKMKQNGLLKDFKAKDSSVLFGLTLRFANMLKIPPKMKETLRSISKKVSDKVGGKRPGPVAAAILYLVSSLTAKPISFQAICSKCDQANPEATKKLFEDLLWPSRHELVPSSSYSEFGAADEPSFKLDINNLGKKPI
mmetsp:Transcript_43769/g.85660  ORF Transcript_43769/g.85660 Transcript_43769/m.85660 type:complete len:335 (+) Transcript_43769:116-1120(+)